MSLAFVQREVGKMVPGNDMEFARELLMFPVPPPWMPAEWVLEGIIGSAFEFSIRRQERTGNVVFRRRKQPLKNGLRTYVSADRKHLFTQKADGLWQLKDSEANSVQTRYDNV